MEGTAFANPANVEDLGNATVSAVVQKRTDLMEQLEYLLNRAKGEATEPFDVEENRLVYVRRQEGEAGAEIAEHANSVFSDALRLLLAGVKEVARLREQVPAKRVDVREWARRVGAAQEQIERFDWGEDDDQARDALEDAKNALRSARGDLDSLQTKLNSVLLLISCASTCIVVTLGNQDAQRRALVYMVQAFFEAQGRGMGADAAEVELNKVLRQVRVAFPPPPPLPHRPLSRPTD